MMRIHAIDIDLIDDINESARSVYPDEFLCTLSAEDGVISEMIMLPGTVYGDEHSFLNLWMAPANCNIVGTAHSHPDYCNMASEADLDLFRNMGGFHLITCMPFDRTSWKLYNSLGEEVELEIVSQIL
jgi:proteasome lid subunit RPN8/RPN11